SRTLLESGVVSGFSRTVLLRRLNSQQRTIVLVSDDVDQSVWSLTHVANALMQFGQQALAAQFFELVVHDDALQSAGARHFATPRGADEQGALPRGNLVAGIEGEAGRRDRRDPQHERLIDAGTERRF